MKKQFFYTLLLLTSVQIGWAQPDLESDGDNDTESNEIVNPNKKAPSKEEQNLAAREGVLNFKDDVRNSGLRIVSYNVENYYDIENDPKTADDEFTPDGMKNWSFARYKEKQNHIAQVLTAVGGWELPEIVGFCEIENRKVLEDLLKFTSLRRGGYDIVHENSADARGVDVGFIYRRAKFKVLLHEILRPVMVQDTGWHTRDVLYVKGIAIGKDTLHLFMNHWPSRRGGVEASSPKRELVAKLVRQKVDAILAKNPQANIVILGDFNDEFENTSIRDVLRAKGKEEELKSGDMYTFMANLSKNWKLGSEKYGVHWGIIDHVIVSEPLLHRKEKGFVIPADGAHIYSAPFLLEEDERNFGLMPFRTYGGPRYLGGYSDHLPIYVDLNWAP